MQKIFISYRRQDDPYAAMSIYDRLKNRFGSKSVFFDIDAIPAGVDFRKHIEIAVEQCDVLLVIIGDKWLERDSDGILRITKSTDFVRIEIETALMRKIPIIPVLVGNAEIPLASKLPNQLRELVYRNAREVRSGNKFRREIEDLLSSIELLDNNKNNKKYYFYLVFIIPILGAFWLLYLNFNYNEEIEKNITINYDYKPIETLANADVLYTKNGFSLPSSINESLSGSKIGKSYALVIGVGEYDEEIYPSLPSEKDATRIKDYLINDEDFDYVRLITGEQVTLEKIRSYMNDYFPKVLNKNDRFLFYWSGQSVTISQGEHRLNQNYLVLKDSSKNKFSEMLHVNSIINWNLRIRAKQSLYLIDACISLTPHSLNPRTKYSSQALVGCSEGEQSIEVSDIDGSIFTSAILDGLRGHADTNKGPFIKDGVVTIGELEQYIQVRVDHERRRVRWDKPITPKLYDLSGSVDDSFFTASKTAEK